MKQVYMFIFLLITVFTSNAQFADFKIPTTAPTISSQLLKGGIPGPSPTIRIRCGTRITTGNEPLYVVDGVVYEAAEIKWLEPNDIEEIHILKDNTATTLYGFRAMHGVIIITTKKAFHRKLFIKDASNSIGIGSVTVKAVAEKTGKQFQFTADEFGRIQTDSLRSTDYMITISSTGYKTKTIGLKTILQNKGEIKLERAFIELNEILVVDYPTIRIYPNPIASNGTIHISFPNVKPGQYQVRLLNTAGQLFYRFQKQIVKAETEQIQLDNSIIPGMYVVQLLNENNQLLQRTKLLVR